MEGGAARFVEQFTEIWAAPSVERLDELMHRDVELIQPVEPAIRGRRAAHDAWVRVFDLIPDLHGEVHRWTETDGLIYIDWKLIGTVGRRRVECPAVDRVWLEDGLVRQRIAYFDPTPLLFAGLTRPSLWPKLVRARLRGS